VSSGTFVPPFLGGLERGDVSPVSKVPQKSRFFARLAEMAVATKDVTAHLGAPSLARNEPVTRVISAQVFVSHLFLPFCDSLEMAPKENTLREEDGCPPLGVSSLFALLLLRNFFQAYAQFEPAPVADNHRAVTAEPSNRELNERFRAVDVSAQVARVRGTRRTSKDLNHSFYPLPLCRTNQTPEALREDRAKCATV
jgi:hypothetical protein